MERRAFIGVIIGDFLAALRRRGVFQTPLMKEREA
jgi:hypothetical protein